VLLASALAVIPYLRNVHASPFLRCLIAPDSLLG
jgi:hypothetical protein